MSITLIESLSIILHAVLSFNCLKHVKSSGMWRNIFKNTANRALNSTVLQSLSGTIFL